jgi:hypothetical protein
MHKHLPKALKRMEEITPTVMPQRQQGKGSEKGEGETISSLMVSAKGET